MKKNSFFIGLILLYSGLLFSQVGINTDGSIPDKSSILDVKSTNKGVLLPRMTFEQRNAILDPIEGLTVYCTNCTESGTGALSVYEGGKWQNLIWNCPSPIAPEEGTHTPGDTLITWNWNTVPIAQGYKWNMVNDFNSAVDLGTATSTTETGLECGPAYTRYVWAYNGCGHSLPALLTQTTTNCCGSSITINHIEGEVAPASLIVTYGIVSNIPGESSKCWISSNLGAQNQADSVNDPSAITAGWYWQFNLLQGYHHDGTKRIPTSNWKNPIDENVDWQAGNDPCAHEMGSNWRIPTLTEWDNVASGGNWVNWNDPWDSDLKLHAAGYLNYSNGALLSRGSIGHYWSSTQGGNNHGFDLGFYSNSCSMFFDPKSFGYSIRCIRE